MFARITGASVNKDGYITRYDYRCTHPGSTIPSTVTGQDCKLGTEGGKSYVASRLALRWTPSSRITVDVVADITRDNSEPGASTLLYVGRQAAPGVVLNGLATPTLPAYVLNGNLFGNATGSPYVINKYNDILVTVANCPITGAPAAPCSLPLNAGNATIKGFEAELALRPVDAFTIEASLAYLNFKYDSISAAAANSGIGREDRGQYISPWQWSLSAQYALDLGGAGTLTPRVDVSHIDSFNRNANNVDAVSGGRDIFGEIKGYTLINARLAYATEDRDWEIALEGRNLTNKLYYADVFDNRGSTASVQGTPAEPRTWAVTLKRRF